MQFAPSTRKLTHSEMVIHRLYGITSRYDAGFDQQVEDLLRLGLDRFDLDIGIVSHVHDDMYEVIATVVPDGVELSVGDRFPLANTYCSVTVEADGPVGFEHAAESSWATHPAYSAFRLEAYIGVPIYRGAEFYGTLNFSSAAPRARSFEEVDLDSLKLMGGWLSTELKRRKTEAELDAVRQELEGLVRTDPLTELLNRRGVRETFERHAERSGFEGSPLSCVLVDIDDFKTVNDQYGHSTGDRVIRAVAKRVRDSLRPTDVAGRIGGDEFLAVLPKASIHDAKIVAERIARDVSELQIVVDHRAIPITVSIGVARLPIGVTTITDVLAHIEDLLKESKRRGKNTVTVSSQLG